MIIWLHLYGIGMMAATLALVNNETGYAIAFIAGATMVLYFMSREYDKQIGRLENLEDLQHVTNRKRFFAMEERVNKIEHYLRYRRAYEKTGGNMQNGRREVDQDCDEYL